MPSWRAWLWIEVDVVAGTARRMFQLQHFTPGRPRNGPGQPACAAAPRQALLYRDPQQIAGICLPEMEMNRAHDCPVPSVPE